MAIASFFKSASKDLIESLQRGAFKTPEEKHAALEELATTTTLKTAEVVGLVFTPDPEVRKAAARSLAARKDPDTVKLFVAAIKGKPDVARRAALAVLAALPLGNVAAQLGALMGEGEAALRTLAAEALLDLPLTAETAPLLTRIIEHGEAAHRLKAVSRFAAVATAPYVPFFEKLADDPDERIRLAAYQTVIKFATAQHLSFLIARVPDEPYATQQILIQGIQTLAPQAPDAAIDQVLTLLASGSTALRAAAIKILLAMPDRVRTVRRFIDFSRGLAGWVRDRTLHSMREFGHDIIGPALELLHDPDPQVRSAVFTLVSSFEDPRVGEAALTLLYDPDWWLALNAADVLGRLRVAGAVPALIEALKRDEVRWAAVEALGHIGGEQALQALAMESQDPRIEIRIEALSALALSLDDRVIPILQRAASEDASKHVRSRAFELLRGLTQKRALAIDETAMRATVRASALAAGAPPIHRLLAEARRAGASDLHISVEAPPVLRINGEMARRDGQALRAEETEALLMALLDEPQRQKLSETRQLDACFYVENDGRYRASLFVDRKGLNGVFRVIPELPPTIADVGLPADIGEIASIHQGIIIVTGPAGCGKSTTLAALVNLINETRRAHIITLEDPVELVHPFKSSLINQREVGRHTETFARALRAALREDPDVIVLGELRDTETVSLALNAAETGHVVLTTLNATTAVKAIDRVITSFPNDEQAQVKESFAGSLKLVIAQALVQAASGQGRVGAFEILKCTHAVSNLIREGKTFQIHSLMQIGQNLGMRTFDEALMQLVREGRITGETAYLRAHAKEAFAPLVPPKFLEEVLA